MGGGRHDCKYGQWLATGRRGLRLSPLARPACELAAARPHGRCPHMYATVWQTCPRRPPAPTTGSGRPARRRVRPPAHVPSLSRSAPPRVCPKGPPPSRPDHADRRRRRPANSARPARAGRRRPVRAERRRRRPAGLRRRPPGPSVAAAGLRTWRGSVAVRPPNACACMAGLPAQTSATAAAVRLVCGDGRPARPSDPRRPRRPPTAAVCVIFLVVAAVSRPWPHG